MPFIGYLNRLEDFMQINGFEGKAFALLVFGVPQKIVPEIQDCRCVGDYDFLGFE
jgi:hypothetical protein